MNSGDLSQKNGQEKGAILVVFGGTGDLFRNKLSVALFDLYNAGRLPTPFKIIGFSRKERSHKEWRAEIKRLILEKREDAPEAALDAFVSLAFYERGDINEIETYGRLGAILRKMDEEAKSCLSKLFYLAVSPELYRPVLENLSKSGLTIPCVPGTPEEKMAWSRVLIEKPFGSDEKESRDLDQLLGKLFKEDQIFRIDHYLAKETVQNILTFRFSNSLFEPLWNRKHIEKVEIKLLEGGRVKDRGSFYDKFGALKDVGQNHMLAMLALVAMENPGALSPEAIRKARAKILKSVKPFGRSAKDFAYRAQYEGYRAEDGISPDSDTETYFKIKMEVKDGRFKGVPFYLESGKALPESLSEIIVYFKEPEVCLCPASSGEHTHQNILTMRIQPNEGISILFWAKRPGFDFGLDQRSLSFSYDNAEGQVFKLPDAYERVLYDCIRGDQTLFASTEEVEMQWRVISSIVKTWKEVPLETYEAGEIPKTFI